MSGFQRPHCQEPTACKAAKPTTHCRRCSIMRVATDPTLEVKRVQRLRERHDEPAFRAEHAARLRDTVARLGKDPAFVERRRRNGARLYRDFLSKPEIVAHNRSPEVRKAAGRKTSEKRLAWCPAEHRDEYRTLIRAKGIPAAEARRIIEAQIPGTAEHGRLEVANNALQMQLKHERHKAEEY
jgi:hypothetical protein